MKRNLSKVLVLAGAFLLASCQPEGASSQSSVSEATSSFQSESGVGSTTSPSENLSSSEPISTCEVTFHYGNGSVRTVDVKMGQTVENPGEDTTLTAARFDGWYLNDALYDFAAPVTSNLSLISKSTAYVDIPCFVYFHAEDDYKLSDGLFSKYGPFFAGYYQQSVTLSLVSETLAGKNLSYLLEKEDGTVIKAITSGTPFTLSEKKLYVIVSKDAKQVSITYDVTGLNGTDGLNKDGAALVDVRGGYSVSRIRPTSADVSKAFMGWKIAGDGFEHRYLPGETISEEDLAKYSNSVCSQIVFEPFFSENVVEVSSWEDLLSVDSDAAVSLVSDIDAGGADTVTGMGGGEFDGILFGNGHTIKNFTSNVADEANNNTGLIDTASHAQIYDLHIDGISISAHGAFGAAAIVGECDDFLIMHNVSVSNLTITNLDTVKYPNVDTIYGIHGGIGGLVGAVGSGEFVGCTVSNFDSSCVPNWLEGTADCEKSLRIGGLIGFESSMDMEGHGLLVKNCVVENSNLNLENYLSGRIGGLIGGSDGDSNGTEIVDNVVRNVTVEARHFDNDGRDDCQIDLGGVAGELDLYCKNRGPYFTSDNKLSVPVAVNRNKVLGCHILYNGSEKTTTDSTTIMAGGIAGDLLKSINGDNTALNFTECDRNVVDDTQISVNPTGSNVVFVGGQFGEIDCDGGNNQYTIFTNNYVNADISVATSSLLHTTVAGFAGGAYAEAEAGIYSDSNVVRGSIKGPGMFTDSANLSTFLDTAGFIGRVVTADADILINKTYVNVAFSASAYASMVGYCEVAFAGMEEETPTITVSNNGVNASSVPGTVNVDMYRLVDVSVSSPASSQLDFSDYYWSDDDAGEPLLKTMQDF